MKEVYLIRFYSNLKQTLGVLITVKDVKTAELFIAKTLELPDLQNLPNVSRIPAGEYACRWSRSHRLSERAGHDVYTYEVLNVPERSGIRMHAANFNYDLAGCVAVGSAHLDINADAELDVVHSGQTMAEFANLMRYKEFELSITD